MKKKVFGMFLALATGLISVPAQAAPGWSSTFTIGQMIPRDVGYDLVSSGASITSPVGCSRTDAIRIVPTAQNYQAIVSTLLTAYSMGKTVKVWVTQCDTDNVSLFVAAWVN